MRLLCTLLTALMLSLSAPAQILKLADLNTTQIQTLDRAHTVLILTDGILEEHGPYLPIATDGYWDEAIAQELARTIIARPAWTAVMFPTVPLGTNAANVIGLKQSFAGSFTIRHSTMRELYMDLADSIGAQGFRYVLVIDSHGGPTNSVALDAASDYFHDTYGGTMMHLLGVLPVVECCKAMEEMLTPQQIAENGMSVHADALEQSQALFVAPGAVSPSYKTAPRLGGPGLPDLIQAATKANWPGYLGAPAYASAALGARYFREEMAVLEKLVADVLDGKVDPRNLPRYGDTMMPLTRDVEKPLLDHEAAMAEKHRRWLATHPNAVTRP